MVLFNTSKNAVRVTGLLEVVVVALVLLIVVICFGLRHVTWCGSLGSQL